MPSLGRTATSPQGYDLSTAGRSTQLDKIYVGFVKDTIDKQYMGRLKVWVPELSGDPNDSSQWFTMNYASPFAGASSVFKNTNAPGWQASQHSYGFWFVPPDLDNEVVCCFINGDPARGIWFGCLYQQAMNHMIPGIPGQDSSKGLPVAEYNKLDPNTNVNDPKRPLYTPLAEQLKIQGLDQDSLRGITTSGVRRDEPPEDINTVYGLLSPGGTQIVLDESTQNKYVRIRTQFGTQIILNDSEGWVYLNTRDGATWFELGAQGDINVYAKSDISIRAEGTLNIRADYDVNIEAGKSIYMKARGENGDVGKSANPGSGAGAKAYTTNTSTVPAITINDTSAVITVSTNNVTGTFVQGMDITGIPWDIPTTDSAPPAPNAGETEAAASNAAPGSGNPVVVVGDGTALGAGQQLAQQVQGTITSAKPGQNSLDTIASIAANPSLQNAKNAVVSVGDNDIGGGTEAAGALTQNLVKIRNGLNAEKYSWVLPVDPAARAAVYGFAKGYGDEIIDPGIPGENGFTQEQFGSMANTAVQQIGQVIPPVVTPATNSTSATNTTSPKVTLSDVTNDGNLVTLYVTFSSGYQSTASNASVITGTLAGETTNNSTPDNDPNYSGTGGLVMINAARDMHLTSDRDMYQRSGGLTSRTAQANMFDWAYGSYDQAAGGYMALESNGLLSIGTNNNMILQGAKVDINGPAAQAAKTAPTAKTPKDTYLKDNEVVAPGEFRFIIKNTILSALPFHEPYDGHNASTQGTNGYVEAGPPVDASSGKELKNGQIAGNQTAPLPLVGQPNKDSPPGKYTGKGYDSKGQPQYSYEGPVPDGERKPATEWKLSAKGLQWMIKEEGVEGKTYPDIGGQPTIGIGHLLKPDERAGNYVLINGKKRMLDSPLSRDEIYALYAQDVADHEDRVKKKCHALVTNAQYDMLVSITYNVGNCNTIAKELNNGNYNVGDIWMSFSYAKNKAGQRVFNAALNKRRQREFAIFSKGTY